MMKLLVCILVAFVLSVTAVANNVRINGKLIPVTAADGLVQLNFSISWDNAWNDPYNWDAVWAFVKYRKKTDAGAWKHGDLAPAGHVATGVNISLGVSRRDVDGDVMVGAFLFPQANGPMDLTDKGVSLVLSAKVLENVTMNEVLRGDVDFSVQLIEMVLVPEGPFYAGDGGSVNSISAIDNAATPALIDSEAKKPMLIGGERAELAAEYPKGYAGFYAMKYELSQAQYADFLNKLSRDQQQLPARVSNLATLKPGDYIFGDKARATARNGIVVYVNEPDRPAIFGCNLTKDNLYNAENDGQTLACNFISLWEMMNYCDWAGLRPMSELEFEKACRKPYPEMPAVGEYAWNGTTFSAVASAADLINPYSEKEYATDPAKNVNCGNTVGPLRCGVFATNPSGVTRETAGSTCCGLMEMSGNLREICYVAGVPYRYGGIVGNYLGDGMLNNSGVTNIADNYWPKGADNFMAKGGGYTSTATELRVSDRSKLSYIKDGQFRDSTLGFRAVRNVPQPETYVDPGKIVGANQRAGDSICSSTNVVTYQVLNDRLPSFIGDMGGVRFNNQWYVKKGELPWEILRGENNVTLNYQDAFLNTTGQPLAYQFRRDITFPGGTLSAPVVKVWVLNIDPEVSALADVVDGCDISTGITIKVQSDAHFEWKHSDGWTFLQTSGREAIYRPKRVDFKNEPEASPYQVTCYITAGKCAVSTTFDITVEPAVADPSGCPCGATIAVENEDGSFNEYPTIQIGTQCWMTKNLNTGSWTDIEELGEAYKVAGIQRGCYADITKNCADYGGLYPWWEVLCGGECTGDLTPSAVNTPSGSLTVELMKKYGVKYTAGNKFIQGICPTGWHVPTDGEWSVLENNIGMRADAIGAYGWARKMTDGHSVRVLMRAGYGSDAWCVGDDCNKTGFNAYFGGYIERPLKVTGPSITADASKNVRWWTSSVGGKSSPTAMVRGITIDKAMANFDNDDLPALGRDHIPRNSLLYVRCIKDY